ncbi:MAG: T9SS type A sorting domain-containing protein [Bacteroidetes bacterium]|nr:T9SS type A sorting domain-containing protein [Bacteroidota bacterium]
MAGHDTAHVSNCVRGSNPSVNDADFSYVSRIQKVIPAAMSDFETDATFNDNAAFSPQNLEVEQKTFAWTAAPNEKFVIWEYTLKNTHATDTLKTLYAGVFADWDIDGSTFAQNRSAYDAATKMGYSYYTATGGKYAGIKLLTSNGSPNFYAMDNVTGGSGGIDPTDGYTTKEKYLTLSTPRLAAGVSGNGNDIINVMSTGPFVLNPGQTVKVAFALLGGDSLSDLKTHANQAQVVYNGLPTKTDVITDGNIQLNIYPNPATQRLVISSAQVILESYEIRNPGGQLIGAAPVQSNQATVDVSGFAEGVYFIHVRTRQGELVKKFIKLK